MPAPKILEKKQAIVADLVEELKEAQSIVFFKYQGLTVEEDTAMRNAFREAGVTYKVVKNSFVKRALEELEIEIPDEYVVGPTAIAYSTEDVVSAPRVCKKYANEFKVTEIKGGVVEGESKELATILQLADIPTQDVLYGKLLMSVLFPLTKLAMSLKALAEKGEEMSCETAADVAAKAEKPAASEEAAEAPAEEASAEEAPAAEEAAE